MSYLGFWLQYLELILSNYKGQFRIWNGINPNILAPLSRRSTWIERCYRSRHYQSSDYPSVRHDLSREHAAGPRSVNRAYAQIHNWVMEMHSQAATITPIIYLKHVNLMINSMLFNIKYESYIARKHQIRCSFIPWYKEWGEAPIKTSAPRRHRPIIRHWWHSIASFVWACVPVNGYFMWDTCKLLNSILIVYITIELSVSWTNFINIGISFGTFNRIKQLDVRGLYGCCFQVT